MKRLVVVFLVVALSLSHVCFSEGGASSSFDFSSMGIDELHSLIDSVNAELASRGELVELHPGLYVVGADLPAGRYLVFGYDDENLTNYWDLVVWKTSLSRSEAEKAYNKWVSDSSGEEPIGSDYATDYKLESGSSLSFSLNDGEVLELTDSSWGGGTVIISKSAPLFSD